MLKRLPAARADELVKRATGLPHSNPRVTYPRWYLHRWHFLPEGYLSRRSAAGYDHVIRHVYTQLNEGAANRAVVERLRVAAPASILEVGCGPGHLMRAVADGGIEADLVAVDLSPYLLERARRRVSPGRVRYVHADGTRLPAGEGEFDAVVASHYLGHLPRHVRGRAATELARVVRPGGTVVVLDHRWHPAPAVPELRRLDSAALNFGLVRLTVFERADEAASRK